jgi:hypothetical protein
MHGYRNGFLSESLRNQPLLLIALDLEEVPQLDSVVFRAGPQDLLGDGTGKGVHLFVVEPRSEKWVKR